MRRRNCEIWRLSLMALISATRVTAMVTDTVMDMAMATVTAMVMAIPRREKSIDVAGRRKRRRKNRDFFMTNCYKSIKKY